MSRRPPTPQPRKIAISLALFALLAPSTVVGSAGTTDLARKAIVEGRLEEARRMLEGRSEGMAEGERLELLTQVCTELGDDEAGVRHGQEAVEASPTSSNAHFRYAVAVRTKMQRVSRVKAMFLIGTYKQALGRARELDPRNLDAREEEIGFLAQAPKIAGGDLDRARALAAELAALHPHRGLKAQIEIETGSGDPARATALFREALAGEDADNPRMRQLLAFHLQRQGQFREADVEFQLLEAAKDPRVATGALYQRARTRILGRYEPDQAIRFLEQFLERVTDDLPGQPSRSHAYWRLGNANEQLNRTAQARAAYSRALELDPDNQDAKKALKSLPR